MNIYYPAGTSDWDIDALSAPDLSHEAEQRLKQLNSKLETMMTFQKSLDLFTNMIGFERKDKMIAGFVVCEQSQEHADDLAEKLEADLKEITSEIARIHEWDAEQQFQSRWAAA